MHDMARGVTPPYSADEAKKILERCGEWDSLVDSSTVSDSSTTTTSSSPSIVTMDHTPKKKPITLPPSPARSPKEVFPSVIIKKHPSAPFILAVGTWIFVAWTEFFPHTLPVYLLAVIVLVLGACAFESIFHFFHHSGVLIRNHLILRRKNDCWWIIQQKEWVSKGNDKCFTTPAKNITDKFLIGNLFPNVYRVGGLTEKVMGIPAKHLASASLMDAAIKSLRQGIPVVLHNAEPYFWGSLTDEIEESDEQKTFTLVPSMLSSPSPFFKNPLFGEIPPDTPKERLLEYIRSMPDYHFRVLTAAVQAEGNVSSDQLQTYCDLVYDALDYLHLNFNRPWWEPDESLLNPKENPATDTKDKDTRQSIPPMRHLLIALTLALSMPFLLTACRYDQPPTLPDASPRPSTLPLSKLSRSQIDHLQSVYSGPYYTTTDDHFLTTTTP